MVKFGTFEYVLSPMELSLILIGSVAIICLTSLINIGDVNSIV